MLTSAELVIFPDLASRFLAGEALDHPVDAYHSPVQAVDAFIAGERSLMVVTDEGVRVSEIQPVGLTGNGDVPAGGDIIAPDLDGYPGADRSGSDGMGGAGCVTEGFGRSV